jgi:hypothetical protein
MNFEGVVEPLSQSILGWVNHYGLTRKHENLGELTNGEFFCLMLGRITRFEWS